MLVLLVILLLHNVRFLGFFVFLRKMFQMDCCMEGEFSGDVFVLVLLVILCCTILGFLGF